MERGIFTCSDGTKMNYLMQRFGDTSVKAPMIVYLHGGDGVGNDINTLLNIPCMAKFLEDGILKIDRNAIVVSPQCPEGTKWYALQKQTAEFIEFAAEKYGADRDRVSLTGCSLGGMGTFAVAIEKPELFSCLVPVCASVDPEKCAVLTALPIWIFHGELDDGMGFSVVDANCVINKAGGNSRLTLLPGEGHEIRRVYYAPEFDTVNWMLDQVRR